MDEWIFVKGCFFSIVYNSIFFKDIQVIIMLSKSRWKKIWKYDKVCLCCHLKQKQSNFFVLKNYEIEYILWLTLMVEIFYDWPLITWVFAEHSRYLVAFSSCPFLVPASLLIGCFLLFCNLFTVSGSSLISVFNPTSRNGTFGQFLVISGTHWKEYKLNK